MKRKISVVIHSSQERTWLLPLMIGCFLIACGLGSCFGQKNLRTRQQQEKADQTPPVTISINPTQPVQVTDYRITDNAPGAEVTRTQEHKAETPTSTPEPTLTPVFTPDPNFPPACNDIGQEWISSRDEMILVCVPAGEFSMGSENEGEDEKPAHQVTLDAYWIDKTEVTNTMFARFIEQTGYRTQAEIEGIGMVLNSGGRQRVSGTNWRHPNGPESGLDRLWLHPVVQVSWTDAAAYCSWAGRVLPTEAQWEKAARGTDGRVFPWGNVFNCKKGNFDDETTFDPDVVGGGAGCDGYSRTSPVGAFPSGASPYGVLDMTGNVLEWVRDWYNEIYYTQSPAFNPNGPESGEYRVLRGGSWDNFEMYLEVFYRARNLPSKFFNFYGFRCSYSH